MEILRYLLIETAKITRNYAELNFEKTRLFYQINSTQKYQIYKIGKQNTTGFSYRCFE